jgi:intein-encoded DNA endonuclease-like protein
METETNSKKPSYDEIVEIRNTIEKLAKVYQLEILRIFFNHNTYMNENQNGTLINMMDLSPEVYSDIKGYIERVKMLELTLDYDEKQKQEYKNTYFN